jgi:hypothetical protein
MKIAENSFLTEMLENKIKKKKKTILQLELLFNIQIKYYRHSKWNF